MAHEGGTKPTKVKVRAFPVSREMVASGSISLGGALPSVARPSS